MDLGDARDSCALGRRLPSIQVNIRPGTLPAAEDNGVRYLRAPLRLDEKLGAEL
jgi:hypothetical protein